MKKVFLGMIIFLGLSSLVVWAGKGLKSINIHYNNIKIIVDGVPVNTSVEPFIMPDGKVVASIEDIAKAFNKSIKYDSKTTTYYIGKQPSGTWNYLSDLKPLNWDGDFRYNPKKTGTIISIASKEYTYGIQTDSSKYRETYVEYNLNGEYTRLTGEVGIDDRERGHKVSGSFFIYLDDNLIYEQSNVTPGAFPIPIDLDITNSIRLKLVTVCDKKGDSGLLNWANITIER
jgi:hypothetical protein